MDQQEGVQSGSGSLLDQMPPRAAKICHEYGGVIWPLDMNQRNFSRLKSFELRHDDVFVISYPKSGTTWAQMIAVLVKFDGDGTKMEGKHIMKIVPFLDSLDTDPSIPMKDQVDTAPTYCEIADAMPTDSPRILKSHALPKFLPSDITMDPKAKVIYVCRNPKDAAVSLMHFCEYITDLPDYSSWDEFFEEFIAGRAPMGPWFENVLHWWKLRNHPNVLFLKYEDMKKDGRKAVEQIATFMGKSFPDDVIDKITAATSFKSMKKDPTCDLDAEYKGQVDTNANKSFFRKGAVGDWKNYFSVDQNRRFDQLFHEKIGDSGLECVFE